MTTISDYCYAPSISKSAGKPRGIPADLVAVLLWSLIGLMLSAILIVSSYSPDLPVLQAMASG